MGKLSDVAIRAWMKSGERFQGRSDGEGLYLRYRTEDAVPRWLFRYRFAGKARVLNIGSYRDLSLADARKTAKEMRARVALGYDVAGEKKERKAQAVAKIKAEKSVMTVAALAEEYFEFRVLGRWKHPNIVRARINNDIVPHLGKLTLGGVKPTDVDSMLKAIVARGAPTMATDCLRWVKRMFDYAIKRELMTSNPAAAFDPSDAGGTEESRTRWLTRTELALLFSAMRSAPGWNVQNTLTVKLLLMLGCRKGELIGAQIDEFDLAGGVWYLRADRTKTGTAIDIPLPSQAVTCLLDLVRMGEGSGWLLPARKMQTRMIPHIDTNTIGAALRKAVFPLMPGCEPFVVHDFRRTARTHLEALGVLVAERCLNHKLKGVVGIYNRHDYFAERKAGLQAWADLLAELEKEGADKVIPIRRHKSALGSSCA